MKNTEYYVIIKTKKLILVIMVSQNKKNGERKMKKKLLVFVTLLVIVAILSSIVYIYNEKQAEKQEKEDWAALVKLYYDNKLEMYEEENATLKPGEIDVAFIGDSLTDMYDLEKFYPDIHTTNRGIGGDTTFGLEERLQVSLYDIQPKVVVMLIGANNFHTMFENYEDILVSLKENLPNSKVVLLSLTAMGGDVWGPNNHIAAFNNVKIKALSEKYGFEYVDLFTPLMDIETQEIYPEYTTDGGHFTDKGYEVITVEVRPVIDALLEEWSAENNAENADKSR